MQAEVNEEDWKEAVAPQNLNITRVAVRVSRVDMSSYHEIVLNDHISTSNWWDGVYLDTSAALPAKPRSDVTDDPAGPTHQWADTYLELRQ